jgi:hypothetical protein
VQAAFGLTPGRPSRAFFGAAAAILLLAASGAAPAVGAPAPKTHAPPPSPAPAGDEPPLVSTSAMDESDQERCVSELTSKKVVFEQAKEATREGCRLSAPVSLMLVAT